MITANEARELMKKSFREDAINYGIQSIEKYIREYATQGKRNCIVSFYKYPYGYNDFIKKYGKEHHEDYRQYDVEIEIKEYFTKNGFCFKLIKDDICGGVRQDPYWVICW